MAYVNMAKSKYPRFPRLDPFTKSTFTEIHTTHINIVISSLTLYQFYTLTTSCRLVLYMEYPNI